MGLQIVMVLQIVMGLQLVMRLQLVVGLQLVMVLQLVRVFLIGGGPVRHIHVADPKVKNPRAVAWLV